MYYGRLKYDDDDIVVADDDDVDSDDEACHRQTSLSMPGVSSSTSLSCPGSSVVRRPSTSVSRLPCFDRPPQTLSGEPLLVFRPLFVVQVV